MLNKISGFGGYDGPIVTIVLDGYGLGQENEGNAIHLAHTPVIDGLLKKYPNIALNAHGTSVGLPDDTDMGNSEVGHNALGAGQVVAQGAKLVNESIASGAMFSGDVWQKAVNQVKNADSKLHFISLLSDGNIHSHIDHLKAMIAAAKEQGVKTVRIHALLDGRDVPARSALDYSEPLEAWMNELNASGEFDIQVASGGGRMKVTMDRYGAEWNMVEAGWKVHVRGEGRQFGTLSEAVGTLREELDVDDQNLPEFVIAKDGIPVGTIDDNDAVMLTNYRGDRAIEISQAFDDENFSQFERVKVPKVFYAGMMEYDGDAHIPQNYLVCPPEINNVLGQQVVEANMSQLAISETQKYGHVTYFWNGNKSGKFDAAKEEYIEIPSDKVLFNERPWMKSAEITDELIKQLTTGSYDYARVNYPNGDMVGHTGNLHATRIAMESLDLCLGRLLPVIDKIGGMALITADHGNAEEMYQTKKGAVALKDGKPVAKTSHTTNQVPCIFYDNQHGDAYSIDTSVEKPGIGNLASTTLNLMGLEAPEFYQKSIITQK
ncbi:MAG: 2,3-bisphosphoglycerate-independent phosphoglycerate mutase [Fibrobacterales bacterium]